MPGMVSRDYLVLVRTAIKSMILACHFKSGFICFGATAAEFYRAQIAGRDICQFIR